MTAQVHVLFEGYVGDRTASTVSLVLDGEQVIVIDPGMVPDQAAILGPLAALGLEPSAVTDLVLSHHHPDHTINAGLFPVARVHDHWAIYRGDVWESRPAKGSSVSPSVRLLETPGHTAQDVTTIVQTDEGSIAFTHLWWNEVGPAEDPYAEDVQALHAQRARVLGLGVVRIVPGHGAAFAPGPETPA